MQAHNPNIAAEIAVQIIGFMVVFLIMKQLAWSKILGAIDDRRRFIEKQHADAEKKKTDLAALEIEYRQRLDKIEQEARAKIQEAAAQGQTLARDIQEKARQDSEKLIERAKSEIEQDLVKAKLTVRNEIVGVSTLIAERILKEKLDEKAHAKLVERFLDEIGQK